MSTRISINGVVGDVASSTISVLDRGFLYGDSIYEVLRTYGGSLFAFDEHLDRLRRSADLLEIELPVAIAELRREIVDTVSAAGNAESYVRAIVTRGAGPIVLDPAEAVDPCRVIIVTELVTPPAELYQHGIKAYLVSAGRTAGGAIPAGAKSGNYLTNLMALRQARRAGGHEAFLVDAHGQIAEGSTSNIFAVNGRRIDTPPLEVGILEGITRHRVIELGRIRGYEVREAEIRPDDLRAAGELFITRTLREVMPVSSVDDRPIGDGSPGPVTRELAGAFAKLARGEDPVDG